MKAFGKPADTPHKEWDREKVGLQFFLSLLMHPVFKAEQKAINEVHYWLSEIASAMLANDLQPVSLGYRNIQDRFRKYAPSHNAFIDALRERKWLNVTQVGHNRKYELTTMAWLLLRDGNYRWLHLLITDPYIRRKNQVAISRRKKRRAVYTDPTMQIIDDFRHGVTFERVGLLRQLRVDNNSLQSPARRRHCLVLHPLIAFETRKFCDLILQDGKIYHEFTSLPWNYRRFALFKGKPYIEFWEIQEFNPNSLGAFPCNLFPAIFSYGESLGLTLVYEHDGLGLFADLNDAELPTKWEKVKDFIQQQLNEKQSPQVA